MSVSDLDHVHGKRATALNAYYFGYTIGGGHFMHDTHLERVRDSVVPWKGGVDAQLQPGCKLVKTKHWQFNDVPAYDQQVQCVGRLHHLDGWTAIAFWDRSGDSRYGSNSSFFFDKHLTFDEAVEQARANFPGIVARMESAGRLQEFDPPSRCDAEPT